MPRRGSIPTRDVLPDPLTGSKVGAFGTSFDGSLYVTFKNGYRDYVSRRQISNVKRALKIKKEATK